MFFSCIQRLKHIFRQATSFVLILCLVLTLSGCHPAASLKFSSTWTDLFDTLSSFTVYGVSSSDFDEISKELHDYLLVFHQETDIYHTYDDIENLSLLNEHPDQPLTVSEQLFSFLEFCKEAHDITDGTVNVMIGAVTSLWHEARETLVLPSDEALSSASAHTCIDSLLLEDGFQVSLNDPLSLIDVGALAKGYAGRLAMEFLSDKGIENYLLDLGGNVCTHGIPSGTGRDHFVIGIQDPKSPSGTYSDTLSLQNECAVTSGDYQRFVEIDSIRYHHLIDPLTLYPGTYHSSVTVVHADPAICDMLSTCLFLMSKEDGSSLLEKYGARAFYY